MNEHDFQDTLQNLLNAAGDLDAGADVGDLDAEVEDLAGCHATAYDEAGILTRNSGLVVRLPDGSEFQVTIVQSQYARDDDEDEDVAREDRCPNCGNRKMDELIWIENGAIGEVECGRCGHHYRVTNVREKD
jgi:hypothetical protein